LERELGSDLEGTEAELEGSLEGGLETTLERSLETELGKEDWQELELAREGF